MKKFGTVLCVALVVALAMGALSAEAAIKLRFAGQNPIEHQNTKAMNQVKEMIEKATNGEIVIEVYPASQLGDYTLIYEELMRGSIDFALISIPNQFDPATQISTTPFMAKDYAEAKKVYAKGGWLFNKVAEIQAKQGIRFLAFNADGFGGLGLTKEPVDVLNPAVKKGVLVRVPPIPVFKAVVEDIWATRRYPSPMRSFILRSRPGSPRVGSAELLPITIWGSEMSSSTTIS